MLLKNTFQVRTPCSSNKYNTVEPKNKYTTRSGLAVIQCSGTKIYTLGIRYATHHEVCRYINHVRQITDFIDIFMIFLGGTLNLCIFYKISHFSLVEFNAEFFV